MSIQPPPHQLPPPIPSVPGAMNVGAVPPQLLPPVPPGGLGVLNAPPPPPPPLPGSSSSGSFHTVLVTHLPQHLANPRALRDLAYPCGSTRGIYVACQTHRKNNSFPFSTSETGEKKSSAGCNEKDSKDSNEKNGQKIKEPIALIRMATSHGASTITRILPLAVDGVKVYNCSAGALLKAVVGNNIKTKEELLPKTPKGEEKEDDQKEINTTNNVKESDEQKEEPRHTEGEDSQMPPMAKKLAEISEHILAEYKSSPPINNSLLNVRPQSSKIALSTSLEKSEIEKGSESTTSQSDVDKDKLQVGSTLDVSAENEDNTNQLKLDVTKAAAAAGGGVYDEEADPLNAPEVIESVMKFKKSLEERDFKLRKQRTELVDKKLNRYMEQVRKRRKEEREKKKNEEHKSQVAQDIGSNTDNTENSGVTFDSIKQDSGKRGVSNLPAWMTKSKQNKSTPDPSASDEPTQKVDENSNSKKRSLVPDDEFQQAGRRKQRIDTPEFDNNQTMKDIRMANQAEDAANTMDDSKKESKSSTDPVLSLDEMIVSVNSSEAKKKMLKDWVTQEIIEYLGEEEVTLIDFVMDQLLIKKAQAKDVLDEMKMVLDEDAFKFVKDLYEKLAQTASGN